MKLRDRFNKGKVQDFSIGFNCMLWHLCEEKGPFDPLSLITLGIDLYVGFLWVKKIVVQGRKGPKTSKEPRFEVLRERKVHKLTELAKTYGKS